MRIGFGATFPAGVGPLAGETGPEAGVERVLVPATRMPELITRGKFIFSMNVAVLMLAVLKHGGKLFAVKF